MLGLGRWSARRKVVAAVTLSFLLFLPLGISEDTQPVVTGHSTFYNGQGFDKCLASVAGIVRTQVMWFNDQVLAERYGGKGTFIYITENGSDDPTQWAHIFSDGTVYDFVDPNGVSWHVDEAFTGSAEAGVDLKQSTPQPHAGVTDRQYVWIVELSAFPIHDQFAGDPRSPNYHDVYNFLDIVDTCKMHRNVRTNFNGAKHNADPADSYDFNITHDKPSELGPGYGHPSGTTAHKHESFLADIWMGTKPVIVPIGADGVPKTAEWESDWATGGQASSGASHTGKTYTNSTGAGNAVS